MKQRIPEEVLTAPIHSMLLLAGDVAVDFYIREDEFAITRYPQHCTLEFAMPVWDDDHVISISVLVRLGGSNFGTFDRWLNAAKRSDLRIVQLLAAQRTIDLFLVSDRVVRPFRQPNSLAGKAAGLVATLRLRRSWTDEEFEARRKRLEVLYPTSDSLWRGARKLAEQQEV